MVLLLIPLQLTTKMGYIISGKDFPLYRKKGCCEKFKAHIRDVICSGNQDYFNYVWHWLCHIVQKPNELSPASFLWESKEQEKTPLLIQ